MLEDPFASTSSRQTTADQQVELASLFWPWVEPLWGEYHYLDGIVHMGLLTGLQTAEQSQDCKITTS